MPPFGTQNWFAANTKNSEQNFTTFKENSQANADQFSVECGIPSRHLR